MSATYLTQVRLLFLSHCLLAQCSNKTDAQGYFNLVGDCGSVLPDANLFCGLQGESVRLQVLNRKGQGKQYVA
jgi:hypothetical protein